MAWLKKFCLHFEINKNLFAPELVGPQFQRALLIFAVFILFFIYVYKTLN